MTCACAGVRVAQSIVDLHICHCTATMRYDLQCLRPSMILYGKIHGSEVMDA